MIERGKTWEVPLPDDPAFVARVRRELAMARERCDELVLPAIVRVPEPNPPPPKEERASRAGRPREEPVRIRRGRVLALLMTGATNQVIGRALQIHPGTVSADIEALRRDYGARSTPHLTALAAVAFLAAEANERRQNAA